MRTTPRTRNDSYRPCLSLHREHPAALPDGWGNAVRQRRPTRQKPLKHRADGETRIVLIRPEPIALLRAHLPAEGDASSSASQRASRRGLAAFWQTELGGENPLEVVHSSHEAPQMARPT